MTTRQLPAFGASFALHVLATLAVMWLASRVSLPSAAGSTPAAPTVVLVQLVEPTTPVPDDNAATPIADATPDDLGIRLEEGASTLQIRGFTFDVEKIVGH